MGSHPTWEADMSLAILAICILGCDIAIYVLFERVYGERRGRDFRRADANGGTLRPRNYRRPAEPEF
jgi:hypothetical protein